MSRLTSLYSLKCSGMLILLKDLYQFRLVFYMTHNRFKIVSIKAINYYQMSFNFSLWARWKTSHFSHLIESRESPVICEFVQCSSLPLVWPDLRYNKILNCPLLERLPLWKDQFFHCRKVGLIRQWLLHYVSPIMFIYSRICTVLCMSINKCVQYHVYWEYNTNNTYC